MPLWARLLLKCIMFWLRSFEACGSLHSFLFPQLKKKLSGQCFDKQKDLEVAVQGSLRVITKDGLLHVMEAQAQRLEKCIEINGVHLNRKTI